MPKKADSRHDLNPDAPFRTAMRDLIAPRFGAMWTALPVAISGDDPEGVHDVRVASRRLRAALDVAAECFPRSWYGPLRKSVKEITGALGEVRDRDVLLEALRTERETVPESERTGLDHLITRVERERDTARAEMLAFLGSLERAGIAVEAERHFGPAAAAPRHLTTGAKSSRTKRARTKGGRQ